MIAAPIDIAGRGISPKTMKPKTTAQNSSVYWNGATVAASASY